jgi:hypothetical protein
MTFLAATAAASGFYLRKATGLENRYVPVAAKALADPARGCKMA